MSNEPENPWLDDQILLGGLTIVHQGLAAFFENLIAVKEGTTRPLSAKVMASLGSSMVEAGNALAGRIINNLPDEMAAPCFPDRYADQPAESSEPRATHR